MHVDSLEAAAVSNKDLFLQKVAFKELQRRESTLGFRATFSLVEDEIFLFHLQEVFSALLFKCAVKGSRKGRMTISCV